MASSAAADMAFLQLALVPTSDSATPSDADSEIDRALQLMTMQRFVEANEHWRAIYQRYQDGESGNSTFQARSQAIQINALLGDAYSEFYAGNIREADNALTLVLKRISDDYSNHVFSLVAVQYLSAQINIMQYKVDSALELLTLAQQWLNSKNLNIENNLRLRLFAKLSVSKGEALFILGRNDEAKAELNKAQGWARQGKDDDGFVMARTAMLALSLRTSKTLSVEDVNASLLPSRQIKVAGNKTQANSLLLYADVVSQIPSEAWAQLRSAIIDINSDLDALIDSSHFPALINSSAMGIKARYYAKSGRAQDAETLLQQAIRIVQQYGDKMQLSRWLAEYGALQNSQGDYDAGLKAYRMAVAHLDAIKNDVMPTLKFKLYYPDAYFNDIYSGLADSLLRQSAKQSVPADQQSLLREARQVLETKKYVDLQNYFHDQCIADFKKNMRPLDDIANADTAVFYPIVLPDRLELLLSHNGMLSRFVSPIPRQRLQSVVEEFRRQLMDVDTRSYLTNARQLYDWIIRPMQATLDDRSIKNLVIVSESLLRTVPFSVFNDGERYLVQKYALALSPALSLTDSQNVDRQQMQVLLGGLSESVQGFPALSYVKGELEEIQDLYANELLLNRDFVISRFQEALSNPQFSIAHVASHSEMSFDSRQSYILTFDGKISLDQLASMTSIAKRRQPIDLLTLSACQTAAGDDRAALGLAGVAVKSGARSVLATLWAIDDLASSLLVSEFYKQLGHADISKAQALRNAQNSLIASRRFKHPAYWSSFLLIGNWL